MTRVIHRVGTPPSGGNEAPPSGDNEALVDYLKRNAMALGWKVPFFFPPVAHIRFAIDPRVLTACVDLSGLIRFSPSFLHALAKEEIQFVIAHECGHLLLLHHERRGDRDPIKWNFACDAILNSTLRKIATQAHIKPLADMLYAEPHQEDWTVEQLYHEMPDPLVIVVDMTQMMVGNGCGPMPAPEGVQSGGGQTEQRTEAGWRRLWREVAAQAQFQGRDAGTGAGDALARMLEPPPPRVRWAEVLRRQFSQAFIEAGKDDVSWLRRSRRSTPEIILPGGVTYKCRAAVAIDSSGSMSDEDLARATAETAAIVNHTGVPTFLVVHDDGVQAACWLRPGGRAAVVAQVYKNLKGRGGTSFAAAYARVEKEGKFNVFVHLTDGCVFPPWPAKPRTARRMIVALVGYADDSRVPGDARVIRVEA